MRFEKQEKFAKIGKVGQQHIRKSSVCVVGCGALGSRCSELLVRAGVGSLTLIDSDLIELSNLQRQTLFSEEDIGLSKVGVLQRELRKISQETKVNIIHADLQKKNISLLKGHDLILDCTDHISIAFFIDDFCQEEEKPFVFGAVAGSYGLVYVVQGSPSFHDVFSHAQEIIRTCNQEGILNSVVSIISGMIITESIKILTKQEALKDLIFYNAWTNDVRKIRIEV